MASLDDLKNVLKDTLDNRGVLNQIRARVRAEVFSALDEQTDTKPVLSNENLFINELIREYLEFNKYKYTSSVLIAESGQPKDPIDREFLATELNITESSTSGKIPILYGLVSHFLEQRNQDEPVRDVRPKKSPKQIRKAKVSKHLNLSNESDDTYHSAGTKGLVYHAPK